MNNLTDKEAERRLNELYAEIYTEDDAVDNFIYLTVKDRIGGSTTEGHIRNCWQRRELGSLLRRLDPVAFHCAKNDLR